ncbi:ribonuclease J [Candidatus Parcubacteria bacterium]|nr:MAG: ribonuclease J [Candidatus Parcubacteria bacterium]
MADSKSNPKKHPAVRVLREEFALPAERQPVVRRRGARVPAAAARTALPRASHRRAARAPKQRTTRKASGRQVVSRTPQRPKITLPPLAPGDVRIIPLGGVEEIGRNMTAIEYGENIYAIDCGFMFSEEETPGIDYILPNTQYLEENAHRVKALFVTHGHLDHIGGIPYILPRIGNPPIYTRRLTGVMIQKRQTEFPHLSPLTIHEVETNDRVTIDGHTFRFFGVTHTIPDSMGIILETPHGNIVVPGDYKLAHDGGVPTPEEEASYAFFEQERNLFLMLDSTNVEQPGFSTPEHLVEEGFRHIIETTPGRLIVGTFASQITRLITIMRIAHEHKKKVVIEGRSMKTNLEVAEAAGLFTPPKGLIITPQEMDRYPKNRIVVLATGAQGEEFAALMRMANKTHKTLRIEPGDTVVLSASIIPGNERSVEKLKDNIAKAGARIVHYRTSEVYVHSTGHGNREELAWLHRKVKPKFFMPIHGNYYRLKLHAELAEESGIPPNNIVVPENGGVIEITEGGSKIVKRKEKVPSFIRMVDGFAIGDVQEVVLRDRQTLAKEGMFVVVALIEADTGRVRRSPDIISRGFVYLRESQDLLSQTRHIVKETIESATRGVRPIDFEPIKAKVADAVERHLFQQTGKQPIVIPVLIAV